MLMMTSQILKSVDFMLTQKSRILISKEDQSRWDLRGKIWAKIKPHALKKLKNTAISGFLIFYRTDASKIETCG